MTGYDNRQWVVGHGRPDTSGGPVASDLSGHLSITPYHTIGNTRNYFIDGTLEWCKAAPVNGEIKANPLSREISSKKEGRLCGDLVLSDGIRIEEGNVRRHACLILPGKRQKHLDQPFLASYNPAEPKASLK
jgi:hypothetical protein